VRHVLNLFNFDGGRKCLIGEAWIPSNRVDDLANALRRGNDRSGSNVPSIMQMMDVSECEASDIPVRMRTNKFTKTYNNIVEAYGVASYGEGSTFICFYTFLIFFSPVVNPAVWTIATFPFLFAVMYGDVGHGLMMLLPALLLILFERPIGRKRRELGEVFGMVFRARYLILLMALCAIYVGFLYNEFYALPMWADRSSWSPAPGKISQFLSFSGKAFSFGVDPAWKGAGNELQFYNSLKMKISIILAYLHMMLGICMHAKNALHFRRPYDFYFEFIPRAVFLTCIIGYMVLLIFWKWFTPWNLIQPNPPNMAGNGASAAPYIIGVMISMFLTPLNSANPQLCQHMLGCPFQTYLEFFLLLVALLCIPVMLLAKPLLLRRDAAEGRLHPDYRHHPFEFGELMVHQVIETIEFVLGSISNTASYLRLWALSLAHSELSIVFYEKALGGAMTVASRHAGWGVVAMLVGWYLWAAFTVAVLLGMEALSSFLHTLRLHWVEFQNKFYNLHGGGRKFQPFSLKKIRKEALAASAEATNPASKED
jgi:V-type H+-transporting ATPase subunit a